MKTLRLPPIAPEMKEVILVAWLCEEGEVFHRGEVIYEVETHKSVCQVEADQDGKLLRQLVEEGDCVQVGSELAEIESLPHEA